jgi:alpha-glucosidase
LTNVVNGYKENNLPLDTQWSDIDYLDNYKDFTHDPVNFKDLPSFVENLHKNNMHYIPILDIGLAQRGRDYEAYTDGVNQDVFIKSANKQIFTGKVWPGDAVYPDFFAKNTATWWKKYLSKLHDVVPFDGLWEDMNEASNFCDGLCYASQMGDDPVKYKLPYIPTARDLEIKSISLDAVHGNGYLELDTHSLIGTQEVQATHDWFIEQGKRPLIIERSSFTGMGKFASRWLGDNFSNEQYMGFSVVGIQAHSIMGIALAGSDICGFIGNTNPELCARWHIVGAFYPFSRNHNDRQSISQEPYVKDFQQSYDKTTSYMDVMELGIKTKYRMIRYYYTEMSLVSRNGGVFYKPLFFEFPNDAQTYNNMQYNVMLGQALKLSVLSDKLNQNTTDFYFPAGTWCNVIADTLQDKSCETFTEGKTVSLPSKAWDFYLHLRAGYIIPMQNTAAI